MSKGDLAAAHVLHPADVRLLRLPVADVVARPAMAVAVQHLAVVAKSPAAILVAATLCASHVVVH